MADDTGTKSEDDSASLLQGYAAMDEGTTLCISTRNCRDVERWRVMPPLDRHGSDKPMTRLDLHKCRYITELHPSIGGLIHLKELSLTRCEQLEGLPSCIGKLEQLEILDMMDCSRVKSLPDEIGNLKRYIL